ncbi:hypothetical protein CYMTET_26017, partial [Cymbomonas tetramitiformis]
MAGGQGRWWWRGETGKVGVVGGGGVGEGGGGGGKAGGGKLGIGGEGVAVVEWEEEEEIMEEEEGRSRRVGGGRGGSGGEGGWRGGGVVEGGGGRGTDREARVAVEGGVEEEELDGEVRVTVEGGVEEGMEMEEAEAGRCSDQLQHRKNALRIRDQGLEVEADKEAEEALGLVELARREVAGVETGMGVTVETVVEVRSEGAEG